MKNISSKLILCISLFLPAVSFADAAKEAVDCKSEPISLSNKPGQMKTGITVTVNKGNRIFSAKFKCFDNTFLADGDSRASETSTLERYGYLNCPQLHDPSVESAKAVLYVNADGTGIFNATHLDIIQQTKKGLWGLGDEYEVIKSFHTPTGLNLQIPCHL